MPASHAKQVSDAVELYRPAMQSVQVSEDSAANVEEYLPASQSVQLEDPEELKEPASQAKQVSDDVAPVAELYRPATQSSLQVSAAEVDEYLPALQGMQSITPARKL